MSDEIVPPPARGRRRLFQPGQSGNPAGRRQGSRNQATLAAATLLDGEALGLTRRAVEAALAGDMLAMKLCLERVLPRCHERPVTFSLPSLAAIGSGEIDEPSPQNVSRAMNAVTSPAARSRRARRRRSPGSTTAPADGGRRNHSSNGPYSTWRKNPPVDFLQMQEAESRRAIRGCV